MLLDQVKDRLLASIRASLETSLKPITAMPLVKIQQGVYVRRLDAGPSLLGWTSIFPSGSGDGEAVEIVYEFTISESNGTAHIETIIYDDTACCLVDAFSSDFSIHDIELFWKQFDQYLTESNQYIRNNLLVISHWIKIYTPR